MIRLLLLTILTFPLLLVGCSTKSTPDNVPPKPTPAERVAVNYEPFAKASRAIVDYDTWQLRPEKATPENVALIEQFLTSVAWAEPDYMSELEQKVFWTNVVNAALIINKIQPSQRQFFVSGKLFSVTGLAEEKGNVLTSGYVYPYQIPLSYTIASITDEYKMKKHSSPKFNADSAKDKLIE